MKTIIRILIVALCCSSFLAGYFPPEPSVADSGTSVHVKDGSKSFTKGSKELLGQ